MKLETKVNNEVNRKKKQLTKRAKKHGFCENFGQKEVSELKSKFNYMYLVIGDPNEREAAKLIEDFDEWCMTLSLEDIR